MTNLTCPFPKIKEQNKKELNMKTEPNKPATTFTCPMHPEVQKDKPGKCPKCGMPLVPK
jgi:Heavy metal binding domain